ncbi:MAG: hypothetical protein J1E31_07975 [Helicobacter sp.]|nr:hypothetical protein [Helicobacter sp.]
MNWLNELKVAYLNKNDSQITELLKSTPTLQTRDEMFEALAVLEQLAEYAKRQKEVFSAEMKKLKQTKKFIPIQEKPSSFNLTF